MRILAYSEQGIYSQQSDYIYIKHSICSKHQSINLITTNYLCSALRSLFLFLCRIALCVLPQLFTLSVSIVVQCNASTLEPNISFLCAN